ncbi:MAG: S9 family peptidase [Saprospiraceae bacterium]|nr:S9 family peptidase [Saprospiraceae bacterium]
MCQPKTKYVFILFLSVILTRSGMAQEKQSLEPLDIFNLEYVSNPKISPDGKWVVYSRNYKDIMTDRNLANLWIVGFDGQGNRPITSGKHAHGGAVWSADGREIFYRSNKEGSSQIYRLNPETGVEMQITDSPTSPGSIYPSPDGKWLAFTMSVKYKGESFAKMPAKPEGAKWNSPPIVIDKMQYRRDGGGYVSDSYRQIFVVTTEGGTAMQLTDGDMNHGSSLSWGADSKHLYFSANPHEDRDYQPNNSEIMRLDLVSRKVDVLTTRVGPDGSPKVSPDGSKIAYTGYDDKLLGYQQSSIYIMDIDGSNSRCITCSTDLSLGSINWAADGKSLYYQYDDKGHTYMAQQNITGDAVSVHIEEIGGTTLGRPYASGSYSVSDNGRWAYTASEPERPAELGVGSAGQSPKIITGVNDDLLHFKEMGKVEEIWYTSSADNREIQGWICYPPDFDPTKKYPLILEIHGGPFANYGPRFSGEIQLFAAAGYIVLYTNPRGSSSYGSDFGNTIHHNYPSEDYDDLISGVDAVIAKGNVDEDRLYVTGGSGGGVLTAWIVGNTDRFKAAVVAKPVINWYSFVLYADNPSFFAKYWFGKMPWEDPEAYHKRSPISLVGNVTTPTMLLTGESDFRTPMAETEQYYAALKLNKVDTKMVRIPGAGHGIAARPSNLIAKVVHILEWFGRYE